MSLVGNKLRFDDVFVESAKNNSSRVFLLIFVPFISIPFQCKNVRFCVYIGKYEKVKIFYLFTSFFYKKRIRCTYMMICASDSLDGVWCVVISSEQAHK